VVKGVIGAMGWVLRVFFWVVGILAHWNDGLGTIIPICQFYFGMKAISARMD
jgi:hypothetical protein